MDRGDIQALYAATQSNGAGSLQPIYGALGRPLSANRRGRLLSANRRGELLSPYRRRQPGRAGRHAHVRECMGVGTNGGGARIRGRSS